jgi:hypothetical protein
MIAPPPHPPQVEGGDTAAERQDVGEKFKTVRLITCVLQQNEFYKV